MRWQVCGFTLTLVGIMLLGGCTRKTPDPVATKPAEVIVDKPIFAEVNDYEDFTGRTEPVRSVEIRSRVTGYLNRIGFVDGEDIQAGKLLFEIDPRTYEATLKQANASVNQAQAHLDRLNRDYERVTSLAGSKSVTKEEYDRVLGDRSEAESALSLAKAQRELAQTNLSYTRIASPISGRMSRRMIDEGNLVKADDMILTTIVSLNPVYATFDIDERTLLRIRRLIGEGKVESARKTKVEVDIGLADEEDFSRKGTIDFIDNKVEATTGTLRVRATIENPDLLLSSGLFVRVRVPVGKPRGSLLIPEEALGSDQGQRYVYVLNAQDEVVYRRVKIGQAYDRYRVIAEGVKPEDRVIVKGLQRVRPGAKVNPKMAEVDKVPFKKSERAPTKLVNAEKKNPPVKEKNTIQETGKTTDSQPSISNK